MFTFYSYSVISSYTIFFENYPALCGIVFDKKNKNLTPFVTLYSFLGFFVAKGVNMTILSSW